MKSQKMEGNYTPSEAVASVMLEALLEEIRKIGTGYGKFGDETNAYQKRVRVQLVKQANRIGDRYKMDFIIPEENNKPIYEVAELK